MKKLIQFLRRIVPKPLLPIYDKLFMTEGGLYIVFGGLTTVVSYVSYVLAAKLLGINFMASELISWVCAVLFAYVTNRLYVFESDEHTPLGLLREFVSFVASRLFSLGCDLVIMWIMVELFSINDIVAKVVASIVVLIVNYVASKLLVFKKKK
ncbi:MAG: GtrA family protein [Clostridia bacterium]|nr:GtrA family protein [Clostridia bacterium]